MPKEATSKNAPRRERQPFVYRDFNLRFAYYGPGDGTYKVWVEGETPGGAMSPNDAVTLKFDPGVFWEDPVLGIGGLLGELDRRSLPKQALFQLGTLLADLAMPMEKVRPLFEKSLVALKEYEALRLRLRIDAPELAQLPWEFMMLPQASGELRDTDFLVLRHEISIVRTDTVEAASRKLPGRIPRIVGVFARPEDQDKIDVEKDKHALEAAIKDFNQDAKEELIRAIWVEKPATLAKLEEAVRDGADVFQYSGHATFELNQEGKLCLEKEDNASDYYDAARLAQLLRSADVRLAVLCACETGRRNGRMVWSGVAPALTREKIPAVIANQFDIEDENAIVFASRLYPRLLSGYAVDEALFEARQTIYQKNGLENRDWGVPVLYLHDQTGVLFPLKSEKTGPIVTIPHIHPSGDAAVLLGRDEELKLAQDKLREGGKVYFHGTYGVGKTSLAAELYRRTLEEREFSDGYLWYQVSRLKSEQVMERIAENFPEQEVTRAKTREEKVSAMSELLSQHKNLLIGLDEVSDGSIAQAILQAAGSCPVILNGTESLNLASKATVRRLKPLSPLMAVQLFKCEVQRTGSGNALTSDDEDLVEKICERMRYLPLAVKLAALKFAEGTESLKTLFDRLKAEPESLDDPNDGVVAVFNTHRKDLQKEPTAWQLLVRIASFPASEAPEAALRADQPDYYNAKDKLTNLGLIFNVVSPDRLGLHPLLGSQVLRVESQAVIEERERTIAWLVRYAGEHLVDYSALDRERANLLGLLDWLEENHQWDATVGLLRSLFNYLRVRGQWEEALLHLNAVLSTGEGSCGAGNRAWAHLHRGIIHFLRSDYALAQGDFDRAGELFAACGDSVYRGVVLYHSGRLSATRGDLDTARKYLEKALDLMGQEGPAYERAGALEQMAGIFDIQGDPDQAEKYYSRALSLSSHAGEREQESRIHLALGALAHWRGNSDAAKDHFTCAIDIARDLGDLLNQALIELEMGQIHYDQGRYGEAEMAFKDSQVSFQQLKYRRGIAQVLHALGNVALARGELDNAGSCYSDALKVNEALGHKAPAAYNQYQLGVVASREARYDDAERAFTQALNTARNKQLNDVGLQAAVWFQLGNIALAHDDMKHLREYATRALKLAKQVEHRFAEAAAVYQLGLLHEREGLGDKARETLRHAHDAFDALKSPEAKRVQDYLDSNPGETVSAPRIDIVLKGEARKASAPRIDVVLKGKARKVSVPRIDIVLKEKARFGRR